MNFDVKTAVKDYTKVILKDYDTREKLALNLAADLVLAQAKLNTPVDTGLLRNSETKQVIEKKALVGTNIEYAPNVEFGTSKQRAKPYLRPALDNNVRNIKKIFKDLFVWYSKRWRKWLMIYQ